MSSYIPRALTKEYRKRLQRRLEKWTGQNTPISINDALTLLRHVETLEKEADWLAMELEKRVHGCEWCCESHCSRYTSPCGYTGPDNWREAARKAVEENSK